MVQKVAKVIIDNSTRVFDKEYSYQIPEELDSLLCKGSKVIVPFGKGDKPREAVIRDITEESPEFELKQIKSLVEKNAVYPSNLVDLASWMKKQYICTYYDALRCIMLPSGISKSRSKLQKSIKLAISEEEAVILLQTGELKTIQQIRIVEALLEHKELFVADISFVASASSGVVKTLEKKGIVVIFDSIIERIPHKDIQPEPTIPMVPTPQQDKVLQALSHKIEAGKFNEVLLHGITGSGKTEVYLQLISQCIENGKNAIMLVPEIALTPQMIDRLRGRFGENVAVIHSRLSVGERFDQWNTIKNGNVKVVIGARSAVFAPMNNVGMIVIDEEHESSYKSEKNPKYVTQEIARWRCKQEKALLLLGSATPSIETYYKALNGEIGHLTMTERANNQSLPAVEIVDLKKELEQGNRSVISSKLEKELALNIEHKKQSLLFLNRRGYASFVLCRGCSFVPSCPNCHINLTYHAGENRLVCHYCGFTELIPSQCPICKSNDIRHFGAGTQRIEDEIKKRFPECTVIRMDSDTTSFKNSFEELLGKFREEKTDIMVGTQMIAKGHDFPDVTLVGVMAADSMLFAGDYKASERTFQLLTQVAGRAGRGDFAGRVVIQAYNTDDYAIVYASKQDYIGFYHSELIIRQKQKYPPFSNIGVVFISGKNEKEVKQKSIELYNLLNSQPKQEEVEVLTPAKAPLSKIRGKYRYRLIIKMVEIDKLIEKLTVLSDGFYNGKDRNEIELSVDINPFNMS